MDTPGTGRGGEGEISGPLRFIRSILAALFVAVGLHCCAITLILHRHVGCNTSKI